MRKSIIYSNKFNPKRDINNNVLNRKFSMLRILIIIYYLTIPNNITLILIYIRVELHVCCKHKCIKNINFSKK